MKTCWKCKGLKSLSEFNRNRTRPDGRHNRCRECMKTYLKDHYQSNQQYYKDKAKRSRKTLHKWFKELKRTLSCSRCPENSTPCLEFHHTDPTKKEISLAHVWSRGWSKKKILEEIDKCEILCANCHHKEHWDIG